MFSRDARVLIDPGSTHSFVAQDFLQHTDTTPVHTNFILTVFTPLGKTMLAEIVCKACTLWIGDRELIIDLILLDLKDFDIILGMDFLASYHATIHCYTREVAFQIPGQEEFSFSRDQERVFSMFDLSYSSWEHTLQGRTRLPSLRHGGLNERLNSRECTFSKGIHRCIS